MWLPYAFADQYVQWAEKVELYKGKLGSEDLTEVQRGKYLEIIELLSAEMAFTEIVFSVNGMDLTEALRQVRPGPPIAFIGAPKLSPEEIKRILFCRDTWVKYAVKEEYWSLHHIIVTCMLQLTVKAAPPEINRIVKAMNTAKKHQKLILRALRAIKLNPGVILTQTLPTVSEDPVEEGVILVSIDQGPDWPNFSWDDRALSKNLSAVRLRQNNLIQRIESLERSLSTELMVQTFTEDIFRSSDIEGVSLDKSRVRESVFRLIANDLDYSVCTGTDVDGLVNVVLDATQQFYMPLTKERLFQWHSQLFPTGRSGMIKVKVGAWRDDANGTMQIVSGLIGRERVHFQAMPADRIEEEIKSFLAWFNSFDETDPVLKAWVANTWFVTIHPFEDGNGRIARAIADMMLARSDGSGRRYYSLSAQLYQELKDYYSTLEDVQKGNLDITESLTWFLNCLDHALDTAEARVQSLLNKTCFWESVTLEELNDRQRYVIDKLFDDFKGKLTTKKWAKLAKCNQDVAAGDINDMLTRGILVEDPSNCRVVSYLLVMKGWGDSKGLAQYFKR